MNLRRVMGMTRRLCRQRRRVLTRSDPPKGSLNKVTAETKEIAHQYGPEAFAELARIATSPRDSAGTRGLARTKPMPCQPRGRHALGRGLTGCSGGTSASQLNDRNPETVMSG